MSTAKKPREKKPKKKKGYFYEEQEQAFLDYVTCEDERRKNEIFEKKLYPALTKMIESIIRRYKLFVPSEDFDSTFFDCLSFLITKVNNYDVSKGTKVYSYCGTICKNYLLLRRRQDMKKTNTVLPYDTVFKTPDSDTRENDNTVIISHNFHTELIDNTVNEIENIMKITPTLTDNERKIGYALAILLKNREDLFHVLGSKKFNKISVYYFIRELTQLTTKEIREGLKVFKKVYFGTKQDMLDEGDPSVIE